MKTAIPAFLFISLLFINNSSSQWVHLVSGAGAGVVLATEGNNIYCGTWFTGISLSTDSGTTWTGLGPIYTVRGILIDGNNIFAATDHNGIFLTTNSGAMWTAVNSGLTDHAGGTMVRIGNYLFTGTHTANIGTVYRSSNNGSSWEIMNNGFPSHTIVFLTARNNEIFAATYGMGIFHSTDLGVSWESLNNGLTDLYVSQIVFKGSSIFAGTLYSGVFLSTDNGSVWVQKNNGLDYSNIDAMTVSGNSVFAGVGVINTGTGGVYITSNDEENWTEINEGLTIGNNVYLYSLIANDSYVYVGLSNGVWRRSLNEITAIQNQNSGVPVSFNLYQNYPNPFNPSAKIKFDIPPSLQHQTLVKLTIYNELGMEITSLVNREMNPGSYEVQWNASDKPSGVYFYKLTAGDYSSVKKMVLVK